MSYNMQTQSQNSLSAVNNAVTDLVNQNQTQTVVSSETPGHSSFHMQKLQDRMNQLEKAVLGLGKKESYVAAMAVDLEHIMMLLIKRLDKEPERVSA